jgi:hypothetical protein
MGWARMISPMMNSIRASPTPRVGRRHQRKAAAGFPMFIMMSVRISGSPSRSSSVALKGTTPVDPSPVPLGAGEGDLHPVLQHRGPIPVPTTAGIPSSRLTMAAWLVRPPWSVMIPAAWFRMGPQSGSVRPVTRMVPAWKRSISEGLSMRDTLPVAMALPMAARSDQHLPGPGELVGAEGRRRRPGYAPSRGGPGR